MKISILFGANSNEHLVSIISGINIYNNLDSKKYTKNLIYLDELNQAFLVKNVQKNVKLGYKPKELIKIDLISELKKSDLVFPIIHGNFGENGDIQRILEKNNIKYIGCDSTSSYRSFDKVKTKETVKNITNTARHFVFNLKSKTTAGLKKEIKQIINSLEFLSFEEKIKYPLYIKAARSGSSIGVIKTDHRKHLLKNIEKVAKVDKKILIEENIQGLEIECAILETNNQIIASNIGLIRPNEDFYTFNSKYNNPSSKTIILDKKSKMPKGYNYDNLNKIKQNAKEIFIFLGCKDLSRIDFFLTKDGFIFNEINTMPGFTEISMYPKLMTNLGLDYHEILDLLIKNHLE